MSRPAAYAGVAYNLSKDYHRVCARLRTVDLAGTAPVKLARLLLEWSAIGQKSGRGASPHIPFTHGEIGGFIGAWGETISRTLKGLKQIRLVDQRGPALMDPNRVALECFAQMGASMTERVFPKP